MNFDALRRALAGNGVTPASYTPEASAGRAEEASIRPARIAEGTALRAFAVGSPLALAEPVAFLDGVQHSEVVGYVGAAPLLGARIAAGVRERADRTLRTVVRQGRDLVLGRRSALDAAGDALAGRIPVLLPDDEPPHPVRDLLNASRVLDRERGALEIAAGDAYRALSDAWIIVDGSISESPRWAQDRRMIGVTKSHSVLPFAGSDLELYLRLPPAHRSSVYAPATRSLAPVRAWGLRLWPWEGKDLLHGLVRVEVAPPNEAPELADLISRWILAERAPISAPDRRWDRLLYGVHSVEQYLNAH
jgi:hypothetical protein